MAAARLPHLYYCHYGHFDNTNATVEVLKKFYTVTEPKKVNFNLHRMDSASRMKENINQMGWNVIGSGGPAVTFFETLAYRDEEGQYWVGVLFCVFSAVNCKEHTAEKKTKTTTHRSPWAPKRTCGSARRTLSTRAS